MKSRYQDSEIRNVRYRLGGYYGGQLFYYTAIPEERTLEGMLAVQASRPGRHACDVIVEVGELWQTGVCWGLQTAERSALNGELLPQLVK